jgi:hypothetical protein
MIRDLDFNFNIDAAGLPTAIIGVTKLIDCSISPARSTAIADLVASLGGIYSCFVFRDPILNTLRARIRGLDFDPTMINMKYKVDIDWDIYIKMVVAQPSFSYTFSALVTTGAPELSNNYVVNIPNYKAAAIC